MRFENRSYKYNVEYGGDTSIRGALGMYPALPKLPPWGAGGQEKQNTRRQVVVSTKQINYLLRDDMLIAYLINCQLLTQLIAMRSAV